MISNQHIQKLGRSLSAMVMPNIGAFIAWGLLTAMFIPTGWFPNESLASLVSPILKYLLPLLIAYTAGFNVFGIRGGVIGSLATMGVIVGSDIPMFIGAMVMGPFAAWILRLFDGWSEKHVKAGFEMLVNNFSLAIIGLALVALGYFVFGGVISWFTVIMEHCAEWVISHSLLPLVSLFVEPAKVMFLNNALNHGIFSPIGIEQIHQVGKSIMFLIETNPGPGLGVLAAISLLGRDSERKSSLGAVIIHFFGGIHEIYFPYVLARPVLIVSTVLGSAAGLFFFSLFDLGLVAPASPGSIVSILAMAPKGEVLSILIGVIISACVSFVVSIPLVKMAGVRDDAGVLRVEDSLKNISEIQNIVFACDAGMGSSALGATRFASRLSKSGIDMKILHSAVDQIPDGTQVVVCQERLRDRVLKNMPTATVVVIRNFLQDENLDNLFDCIVNDRMHIIDEMSGPSSCVSGDSILSIDNIRIGLHSSTKEEAIRMAGTILEDGGYVHKGYAEAMIQRECEATTYMGMGVAIPHGTLQAKKMVCKSGISVLQFPSGVDFDGETAYFVIGIAGVGDEHMEILAHLAEILENEDVLNELFKTEDKRLIYDKLK